MPDGRGALPPLPEGRGALFPVRIELPPGRGAPGRTELLPVPDGRGALLPVPVGRGAPPLEPVGRGPLFPVLDGRGEPLPVPEGRLVLPVEPVGRGDVGREVEEDVVERIGEGEPAGRGLGVALLVESVGFFSACSGLTSGESIVGFKSSPIPSSLCRAIVHNATRKSFTHVW